MLVAPRINGGAVGPAAAAVIPKSRQVLTRSTSLPRIEHMFEAAVTTETLTDMVASLSRVVDAAGDQERIDQIRLLEELKSAAAAAQAMTSRGSSTHSEPRSRPPGAAGTPSARGSLPK